MVSDIEIMNKGIRCLLEKLGVVETERFIAVINKEKFDYTKWQRERNSMRRRLPTPRTIRSVEKSNRRRTAL